MNRKWFEARPLGTEQTAEGTKQTAWRNSGAEGKYNDKERDDECGKGKK